MTKPDELRTILHELYPLDGGANLVPRARRVIARRRSLRVVATASVAVAVAALVVLVAWRPGSSPTQVVGGGVSTTDVASAAGSGQGGGESSCAAALVFRGRTYLGTDAPQPPGAKPGTLGSIVPATHRHKIGSADLPPCADGSGGDAVAQRVEVYQIDELPVATVVADAQGEIYLARNATMPAALVHAPWLVWITR